MTEEKGVIYILTNPSFPKYVKIGYADNVKERLNQLNRSECIPFAFRLYAYYRVPKRLTDMKLHQMIDRLNPNLRAIEEFDGKKRVREFYEMSASDAYSILETIAEINGLKDNLVLIEPTVHEIKDEEKATEGRMKRTSRTLPRMNWLIEQGIVHKGDEVYVLSEPTKLATILDDKKVSYNGKVMSLNEFGCMITGWKSIQIYAYTKIKGQKETLSELREKRMSELGMLN